MVLLHPFDIIFHNSDISTNNRFLSYAKISIKIRTYHETNVAYILLVWFVCLYLNIWKVDKIMWVCVWRFQSGYGIVGFYIWTVQIARLCNRVKKRSMYFASLWDSGLNKKCCRVFVYKQLQRLDFGRKKKHIWTCDFTKSGNQDSQVSYNSENTKFIWSFYKGNKKLRN